MANKVSFTIPEPPKDATPQMRQMLSTIKEALEVRLGRRGDPLEEGITKRDLIESGIAVLAGNGTSLTAADGTVDSNSRITPPAPVAFSATGVFGGISLTWDSPFEQYNVHAYAEIWRSETPNAADRLLLTGTRGVIYFDRVPDDGPTTFYYWLRFVSEYDKKGPFSAMVKADKQADVTEIMGAISGQINASDLSATFQSGLSQQASTLDGLKQQSYLRLNVNGYISGYGAYNDGKTSQFAIIADTFWIASPTDTYKTKPFIIVDGKVYMDTAVIRDGTIQEGKLGAITFGKLVDGAGNPVTTVAGKLRVDMIDVNSLQVTDANFSGVLRSTQVASNGQPRWILDKNGGMAWNSSNNNGRMEIRDNVMKFFDANGRIRIQQGDLTL